MTTNYNWRVVCTQTGQDISLLNLDLPVIEIGGTDITETVGKIITLAIKSATDGAGVLKQIVDFVKLFMLGTSLPF